MNAFFMKLHQPVFWMFGLILCGLFFIGTPVVHASTLIYGTITEDTVLTPGNNPYEVGDTVIAEGVTLTIEAGVILKFNNSPGYFDVKGSLVVEGTEEQPVYFTSMHDDSVGGDTNNNGSSTVPNRSDWQGIIFYPGSSGTINHAVLRYGGYYRYPALGTGGIIYNSGGTVDVTDSTFSNTNFFHLGQESGVLNIMRVSLTGGNYGVVATGGDVSIQESVVRDAGDHGVRLAGTSNATLVGNTFEGNSSAVTIDYSDGLTLTNNNNVATGNDLNGIRVGGTIVADAQWQKDGMPYVVCSCGGSHSFGRFTFISPSDLSIEEGISLTIDPGTIIKFLGDGGKIEVEGTIEALGTEAERIYFTSEHDDSIGGDLRSDGSSILPEKGDWGHLRILDGGEGQFAYNTVTYGGKAQFYSSSALFNSGGTLTIQNSELAHNGRYAIRHESGTTVVSDSSIHDNDQFGVYNEGVIPVDARNNYWGSPTGPYHESLNPIGTGDQVSNNVLFEPWSQGPCTTNCYSNILFIPGIKATELYEGNDRVWLPGLFNVDAQKLAMTNNGESTRPITVGDPLGSVRLLNTNLLEVYESFLESLKSNNYLTGSLPYDWRYDVYDVVANDQELRNGEILNMAAEVREMAASSKTGKVTLIAHSNGGLVGKVLIDALDNDSVLIDTFIMVGTPQLGTPSAIDAFLHGSKQDLPGSSFPAFLMSKPTAREISRNMPGAYGLLPLRGYFEKVADPVVVFDQASTLAQPYVNAYGDWIGGSFSNSNREMADLSNFLLGTEGRTEPSSSDILSPIKLNQQLLHKAETNREALETWAPPENIKTIQIAGWGKETVSGVMYKERCVFGSGCFLNPEPLVTSDGDETVVSPSAAALSGADTYYFNLHEAESYNHTNLLAAPSVQELIRSILTGEFVLPEYITTTVPNIQIGNRLHVSVHSPITLGVHDSEGRYTGLANEPGSDTQFVVEEIPGSSYFEFGEGKYLSLPLGEEYGLNMKGTDNGLFRLEIAMVENDKIKEAIQYSNIPITTGADASLVLQSLEEKGSLEIDDTGDGVSDRTILPDGETVETNYSYADLLTAINELDLKSNRKRPLIAEAKLAERWNGSKDRVRLYATLEDITLDLLSRTLDRYVDRKYTTKNDIELIQTIINYLKDN